MKNRTFSKVSRSWHLPLSVAILCSVQRNAHAFTTMPPSSRTYSPSPWKLKGGEENNDASASSDDLLKEAQRLKDLAQDLRAKIETEEKEMDRPSQKQKLEQTSPENQGGDDSTGIGYRLYVDIGREDGTWMEPRWGASGNRIEFTVDVNFMTDQPADKDVINNMPKDNLGGRASPTFILNSEDARLRRGFDTMGCRGGGYRIDTSGQQQTARFYLSVDGTPPTDSSYGDVTIPQGGLYFSLPCFKGVAALSSREGIVSIREYGWHTGWYREESRIVGIFRAVPIDRARSKDGF